MGAWTDRLNEIQARLDAATPGPWVHNPRNGIHKPNGHCVATTHSGTSYDDDRLYDAAFIAAARDDIPFLLMLVDMLKDSYPDFDADD